MKWLSICSCFLSVFMCCLGDAKESNSAPLSRERYRYEFLEEHLDPDRLLAQQGPMYKQMRMVARSVVSMTISLTMTYVIIALVWQLPYVQNEITCLERIYDLNQYCKKIAPHYMKMRDTTNQHLPDELRTQPPLERDLRSLAQINTNIENIERLKKQYDSLFGTIWMTAFSFCSPIVYKILTEWAQDHEWTYTMILSDMAKHWWKYKICIPVRFHTTFDWLHTVYHARSEKLEITEEVAEHLVKYLVMQCLDYKLKSAA